MTSKVTPLVGEPIFDVSNSNDFTQCNSTLPWRRDDGDCHGFLRNKSALRGQSFSYYFYLPFPVTAKPVEGEMPTTPSSFDVNASVEVHIHGTFVVYTACFANGNSFIMSLLICIWHMCFLPLCSHSLYVVTCTSLLSEVDIKHAPPQEAESILRVLRRYSKT